MSNEIPIQHQIPIPLYYLAMIKFQVALDGQFGELYDRAMNVTSDVISVQKGGKLK